MKDFLKRATPKDIAGFNKSVENQVTQYTGNPNAYRIFMNYFKDNIGPICLAFTIKHGKKPDN